MAPSRPPLGVVSATFDMRRSCTTVSTSSAVCECSQKAWMVMRGRSRAPDAISPAGSSAARGSLLGVRKLITQLSITSVTSSLSVENKSDRPRVAAPHAVSAHAVHGFEPSEENRFRVAGNLHVVGGLGDVAVGFGQVGRHENDQLGLA